jgi:hypothetical protein
MKRQHVSESYFVDGGSTTKDAIIDYLFKKRPRYLRAEAIDKLFPRDQIFLHTLMETCKVSEKKDRKTREAETKKSVLATSTNLKLSAPSHSRFFVAEL